MSVFECTVHNPQVALDGRKSYNLYGQAELSPPLELEAVAVWLFGVPEDQVIAPLPQPGGPAGEAAGAGDGAGQGQDQGGAMGEPLDGRLRELRVSMRACAVRLCTFTGILTVVLWLDAVNSGAVWARVRKVCVAR